MPMAGEKRVAQAWTRLEPWARKWHHSNKTGWFIGTLGGGPASEVYFHNVSVDKALALVSQFETNKASMSCERIENGETVETEPRNIEDFEIACKQPEVSGCHLFMAFVHIALVTGEIEVAIALERISERLVDLKIIWSPHVAFINAEPLEKRFAAIFEYFFSLQRSLNAATVFFKPGSVGPPSPESDQSMEL
jgi:hypothetical protein